MAMVVTGTLFSLPESTVNGAAWLERVCGDATCTPAVAQQRQGNPEGRQRSEQGWNEHGATCSTCGIGYNLPGFENADEQRKHFKTDWHKYNLKRRVAKLNPVSEEEFSELVEQESNVSSISGSEDSATSDSGEEESVSEQTPSTMSSPYTFFSSQDGHCFGLLRCLLVQDHLGKAAIAAAFSNMDVTAELLRVRCTRSKWAVLLLRGGHFAAAIFESPHTLPYKDTTGLCGFEIVAHKTFHRYVVRACAGGKQSGKDATGKFAKSAGARLRRHNEVLLERDVHDMLLSWRPQLDACSHVFIHAPGSNMKVLINTTTRGAPPPSGSAAAVLQPSDPRIRRIPFIVRRPTYSEVKRVVRTLVAVVAAPAGAVAGIKEEPPASSDVAPQPAAATTAAAVTCGAANDHDSSPSTAGLPAQHDDDAEAAGTHDGCRPSSTGQGDRESALHRASKKGDASRVSALLDGGADPAARDERGRSAYQVAANKEVRDAFRRFRAKEPDRWDYEAAQVPVALTQDLEAAQQAKKAEKRAKQKAKERERKEAAEQRQQRAVESAPSQQAAGDEVARAVAEVAAIAARSSAAKSASKAGSSRQASQRQASARPVAQPRPGLGSAHGRASAAAATAPLSAAEVLRRRELQAAAAEARMRALQEAAGQQRLY